MALKRKTFPDPVRGDMLALRCPDADYLAIALSGVESIGATPVVWFTLPEDDERMAWPAELVRVVAEDERVSITTRERAA